MRGVVGRWLLVEQIAPSKIRRNFAFSHLTFFLNYAILFLAGRNTLNCYPIKRGGGAYE